MLSVDPEIGTSALRLWVAAGSAAFLILACMLALFWSPARASGSRLSRVAFVVGCAAFGAAMTWSFLDRGDSSSRGAERRALELRAQELAAQALAPGSPLACLDAIAGESVETACEKALFASPAGVAAASSYAAARLTLLTSMAAYVKRGGTDIDDVFLPLRRSLEADRFGFLAHVLAVRDGCTNQNCKALGVLRDAGQVRTHLSADTLDRYLDRYQAAWAATPDASPADGSAQAQPNAPHKMVNIDFPSAASIPAVSIMNPEPASAGASATAASGPNGQPTAQHRARKSAANTAQPASSTPGPEPIWPEPVPPPPAAQPAAASAGPMQLNPPSPASPAAARTQ